MTTAIQTTAAPLTPFEPTNLDQALALATTLSKSGLIPDSLKGKPSDVLVVLMTGREMGLGPMQSLRGISVIKGKPTMSADLMVAQCLRHRSVCEYFRMVESTATVARYQTKRAGSEPVDLAWTMEDAQRAGLDGSQTWKAHPAAMLRARCSSALARAVYPDLVGGMYEEGEGEEIAGKVKPVVSIAPPVERDVTPPAAPVVEAEVVEPAPPLVLTGEPEPVPEMTRAGAWDYATDTFGPGATAAWWKARRAAGIPDDAKGDAIHPVQAAAIYAELVKLAPQSND